MALKLKTAPTTSLVTLAEAKLQCKVDDTDQDALLQLYIDAFTDHIEGWFGTTGRCIRNQVWELHLDAWPDQGLQIPLGPVISVDTVQYYDTTGTLQTWANTNYVTDLVSEPAWIAPVNTWPTAQDTMNAVRITFTAGMATVPPKIKAAALLWIASRFTTRENEMDARKITELPYAIRDLLGAFTHYNL